MKYNNIISARFISRPNRFVAYVNLNGTETAVHVKNTGRCRELLLPDSMVYLEDFTHQPRNRKLMYDLIAVEKGDLLINMDSQAPNKVVREALENVKIQLPDMKKLTLIRPETVFGDSRFDFYIEDENGQKGFIEVKGVTLENDSIAAFPDAPTERGVKHINELIKAKNSGYNAYILFVVQMSGMKYLIPNDTTHKAFGDALRFAHSCGVHVLAYECAVEPDSLDITGKINAKL
ncbi:MAG: DNA/RNA nuclease SfsA [Ruminococcus sp.]|nr:DNA/RNA nuclease SfsA [Ruminococcus sp.]